jgi:hypothetical protein
MILLLRGLIVGCVKASGVQIDMKWDSCDEKLSVNFSKVLCAFIAFCIISITIRVIFKFKQKIYKIYKNM